MIEFLQSIDLPVWLWLIALVIFGVVEAATAGLVCIWFAMGAMAALLAALVGTGVVEQVVVFAVVSAATLAATRPLVRRMTAGKAVATNADRVLGAAAKVTETIDNENSAGAVYVDGKTWTARSADGSVLPAGSRVEIRRMEGVKLIVEAAQKAPDKKEEVV